MRRFFQQSIIILTSVFACRQDVQEQNSPLESAILLDANSFYFVDFDKYPKKNKHLPIGVFDSGTGGLTVLDALVKFDQHRNADHSQGGDSVADFSNEKFIYLADQANMPYGTYFSENKSDLLVEHILKDAQFLLSNKYYTGGTSQNFETDKEPVKIIIVACNTATAYGKKPLETFIRKSGSEVKIIGVIDAGAKGALEVFERNESGSIGVLATVGTIASKGYENTIRSLIKESDYTGNIMIFNQAGYGIAEAVDGEPDFINYEAKNLRSNYRGPDLIRKDHQIEKALWDVYHFNNNKNKIICNSRNGEDCAVVQLNDPENYVRFHLVSLLEQLRTAKDAEPLKVLVLGCTHYPYLSDIIRKVLDELYHFKRGDVYLYRSVMVENIKLIDPAINVAKELHAFLEDEDLFNRESSMNNSEFYISVPNLNDKEIKLDSLGHFTYDYKYGRTAGKTCEFVKVVPFGKDNISVQTLTRLQTMIPVTFELIETFINTNPKSVLLREDKMDRRLILRSKDDE